jgi:hypothetical protein
MVGMPQLGVVGVIELISAIAGIGSTAYSLANRPSAPKAPTSPPAGVSALERERQMGAEKAAIGQQTPNVVAATSGLANPEYIAQISQLLSGTAGQPGSRGAADAVIRQVFGLGAPSLGGGGGVPAGTQGTNFTPASASSANLPPAGDATGISDFVRSFV